MKFDNPTEATMSTVRITDTAAQRYGYSTQSMFAATRAGAERRARETAVAAAANARETRPTRNPIRRLATRLNAS